MTTTTSEPAHALWGAARTSPRFADAVAPVLALAAPLSVHLARGTLLRARLIAALLVGAVSEVT